MGNAVSQDTDTPPPKKTEDNNKLPDTRDEITQTEDARDADISLATSRPEDSTPYRSAYDHDYDNTCMKIAFSKEKEKEQLDIVTLDDLKLTLEKNSNDMNEMIESLQNTLEVNEEHTRASNVLLSQLQDTVNACFETKFDASSIVSTTQVSSGHGGFIEHMSKSVVDHLLNSEQFRDLLLQRDTQGEGNIAYRLEVDLTANRDASKKFEQDKGSSLSPDDCCKCICKKCKCTCHSADISEQNDNTCMKKDLSKEKEKEQLVPRTFCHHLLFESNNA